MMRWLVLCSVAVLALVALSACAPPEPLSADDEALCEMLDPEQLDVFAEDVFTMSPAEFEAAQRSQTETFAAAAELAPPELVGTLEWIVGQFEAINAVYEDIGWDLARADDADPALLSVVANQYPEREAGVRYAELDDWMRRC